MAVRCQTTVWIAFGCVLTAVCFMAYAPSLDGPFQWDDDAYITYNPFLTGPPLTQLRRMWTDPHFSDYAPVLQMSLAVQYRLWRLGPAGYRVVNVLFHVANALLVLALIRRITGRTGAAAVAALWWALHPLQTENVAWIAEWKSVLSLFFCLLSFLAYLRASRDEAFVWLPAAVALFAASLLTKSATVMLPVLLIAYELSRRAVRPARLLWSLPFFALSVWMGIKTLQAQGRAGGIVAYHGESAWATLSTMPTVVWKYVGLFLLPVNQCGLRSPTVYASALSPAVIAAALGLAVYVGVVVWIARRRREWMLWAVWFPIAILPVLNIVPIRILMAERYYYFPAIGLCALLGLWVARERRGHTATVLVALVCLLLVVQTRARSAVWGQPLAFWRDVVAGSPDEVQGRTNLSRYYLDEGHDQAAERQAARALTLDAKSPFAHSNLGLIYLKREEFERAAEAFRAAIPFTPEQSALHRSLVSNLALTHRSFGLHLVGLQRYEDAESQFLEALQLDPDDALAHHNLAVLYLTKLDQPRKGVRHLKALLKLRPDHPQAAEFRGLIDRWQ